MEKCIELNDQPENHTEDPQAIEHVGYCLDFINAYKILNPNAQIHPEMYVPYKKLYGQPLGGTIDIIGINEGIELMLADLKTGSGYVDAQGNTQLLSYALACREQMGQFPQYKMVIIQPALKGGKGPIREWVVDNSVLDAFESQVHDAIKANLDGGERLPGEHCRYCNAEPFCKPRAIYALNKAGISLQEFIKDLEVDE
jgi:hypothetical protein